MPTLDDMRGRYTDRYAVVLGAGPSLRMIDDRPLVEFSAESVSAHIPDITKPRPFGDLVVIAVNDAILKAPDADFYFTSDVGMCQYVHWDILCRCLSVPIVVNTPAFTRRTMLDMFGVPTKRIILYGKHWNGVKMSRNDHTLIYGPSSGHCAVHFAYLLGCKRIYLLGCDGKCVNGLKYFWQFRDQPGPGGTRTGHASHNLSALAAQNRKPPPSIYDDFDARTGASSVPIRNGWIRMARVNPGFPMYDASNGAAGDAFPRISIHDMLEGKP